MFIMRIIGFYVTLGAHLNPLQCGTSRNVQVTVFPETSSFTIFVYIISWKFEKSRFFSGMIVNTEEGFCVIEEKKTVVVFLSCSDFIRECSYVLDFWLVDCIYVQ